MRASLIVYILKDCISVKEFYHVHVIFKNFVMDVLHLFIAAFKNFLFNREKKYLFDTNVPCLILHYPARHLCKQYSYNCRSSISVFQMLPEILENQLFILHFRYTFSPQDVWIFYLLKMLKSFMFYVNVSIRSIIFKFSFEFLSS